MNKIFIDGIVVDNSEEKMVGDKRLVKFRIKHYQGKNKDGTYKPSGYYNVQAWGDYHAPVAKDDKIIVEGRLELREYEHGGVKKLSPDITADRYHPLLVIPREPGEVDF